MERGRPYIRLRLEVPEAIELGNFVSAFTSLAGEYDRFMRGQHPDTAPDASLYVSEVRKGSIEAILIPVMATLPAVMEGMSQALTIEDFVRRYGARLSKFLRLGGIAPADVTKTELKDFTEQVAAIARAPGSNIEIAAIEIKNGDHEVKAAIKFDTKQARIIGKRCSEATAVPAATSLTANIVSFCGGGDASGPSADGRGQDAQERPESSRRMKQSGLPRAQRPLLPRRLTVDRR